MSSSASTTFLEGKTITEKKADLGRAIVFHLLPFKPPS